MTKKEKNNLSVRAPIVAVMGHIDHGKSTLLDYIRKSNVVEGEAGGITQHLGAYEVIHQTESGQKKNITFLDTPGHEAFTKMRSRGAEVADIVILMVAADDGVKLQTVETLKIIAQAKVPYIVAINKTDKPGANVEKVKTDLASSGVYLEGFGGQIPFVPISAKTGEGVSELLDIVLLMAEMTELKKDDSKEAEGFVIESRLDPKRGGLSTLIIKNGTLKKGSFIIVGKNVTPVRQIENSAGQVVAFANAPSPVQVTGFAEVAPTGARFKTASDKKGAEKIAEELVKDEALQKEERKFENIKAIVPIVLKVDVSGSLEAIEKELLKLETDDVKIKFILKGVGNVNENDLKIAGGSQNPLVIGFNVKVSGTAKDMVDKLGFRPQIFNIIYDINPVIAKEIEKRTPKVEVEETVGKAKILKIFSKTKARQIVGGTVYDGSIFLGKNCKILRQSNEVGRGVILDLQQQKTKAKEVTQGNQFGALIESKITLASDDVIEIFEVVKR